MYGDFVSSVDCGLRVCRRGRGLEEIDLDEGERVRIVVGQ